MEVKFFKQTAIDLLVQEIPNHIRDYENDSVWVDTFFQKNKMMDYSFQTNIVADDYQLILGDKSTDAENARILYSAYKDKINPIQATDVRFWAYLSHVVHWDYMRKRWPIEVPDELDDKEKNTIISRIKSRYFGSSATKAFVRQGLSRLYWGAYLTYDETNEDPFEYTDYIFSDQDLYSSLVERSYSRNKVMLLAILKELKEYDTIGREDRRKYLVMINQSGAITAFDAFDQKQAEEFCCDVMLDMIANKYVE